MPSDKIAAPAKSLTAPSWHPLQFLTHRNCKIMNVYCRLLSSGMTCHTALDNQYLARNLFPCPTFIILLPYLYVDKVRNKTQHTEDCKIGLWGAGSARSS